MPKKSLVPWSFESAGGLWRPLRLWHLGALSRLDGGATGRLTSYAGSRDVLVRHADEGAAGGLPPGAGERGRRRCTGLQHDFWPTPRRPPAAKPPPAAAPPTPATPSLQLQRPRFRCHAMSYFSLFARLVLHFRHGGLHPPGSDPRTHTRAAACQCSAVCEGGSAGRTFSSQGSWRRF